MMVNAGGKKVDVQVNRKMRKQGRKGLTRKMIIVIIGKVAGKAISTGVVGPAKVDSLEPDIVGKTIFP